MYFSETGLTHTLRNTKWGGENSTCCKKLKDLLVLPFTAGQHDLLQKAKGFASTTFHCSTSLIRKVKVGLPVLARVTVDLLLSVYTLQVLSDQTR